MDRLSKRKFLMVCHEKVVRIPLEGDEIRRVHDECTQGAVKTLMNTKVDELKLSDISVIRDFIDVFPEDLSMTTAMTKEKHGVHLKLVLELLRKEKLYAKFTKSEKWRVKLRRVRAMSMTIQSGVKDKILATPSETSKVENAPAEMLRDLDQQMEKRADDGCTLWIKLYKTTDKVVLIKEKLKAMRYRQKSYADNRCKPLEFEVGDRVMLKVSPCKGVVGFGKKGKLAPRCLYAFMWIMWEIGSQSIECDHLNEIGMVIVLVFVEAAKHQAWAIRDYCMLCATCYCDMDHGTRSVPLFVMLERDRLKTLMDC
ncbi:hypothetical protein Tco_1344837 [Tanacetum coccineum]